MIKKILIVLFTTCLAFSANGGFMSANKEAFKQKVASLIVDYGVNYQQVNERLHNSSNEQTLNRINLAIWDTALTFKSRVANKDSYQLKSYMRLYMGFFYFENAENSKLALAELLKCFGTDCTDVNWGEEGQFLKTLPCVYVINDNEIICCKINCEQLSPAWNIIREDVTRRFGNRNSKIIQSGCGGPLNFK